MTIEQIYKSAGKCADRPVFYIAPNTGEKCPVVEAVPGDEVGLNCVVALRNGRESNALTLGEVISRLATTPDIDVEVVVMYSGNTTATMQERNLVRGAQAVFDGSFWVELL